MNTIQLRNERNEAVTLLSQALGKQIDAKRLSQSMLRSGIALGASASYELIFAQSQKTANVLATDNLLIANDAFLVTHMAVRVSKIGSDTSTPALQAVRKFYSYVNPYVFDGVKDANLQAIYNGKLQVSQNQGITFPNIETSRFERVPDAQEGNPTALITGTTVRQLRDAKLNELWGFTPVFPFVVKGDDQMRITAFLAGGSLDCDETNEINYLDIELKGWLISNGNS